MASLLKMYVDYRLKEQSPLKLILISAGAAYSIARLQNFLTDPELCKSLTASFISEKSYQSLITYLWFILLLKLLLKEPRGTSSHGFASYHLLKKR